MLGVLGLWIALAPVRVDWVAPPDCASASEVEAAIAQRLDPDIESEIGAQVKVRVEDGVYAVAVELEGREGSVATRRLEARSCDDAVTAAAVVVALAVVGEQEAEAPPPEDDLAVPVPLPAAPHETPPPAEPASEDDPVIATPPTVDVPRGAGPGWAAHLGAGASAFGLGPVSALLLGEVSAFGRRWLAFVGVAHRVQRQVRLGSGSGAAFRLTAGRGGAGLRIAAGPVQIPLRIGAEGGAVWAQGRGVEGRRTVRRLWLAVLGSVAVGGDVSRRVALFAGVEGAASLLRTPFTVEGGSALVTTGPVALRGFASVRIRLDANFSSNR